MDTASYSNTRRFLLNENRLPPKDAVRIEELVNYFPYEYPQPTGGVPFSVNAEVADCPWNAGHRLVRIGLQGRRITSENLPPANLVCLVAGYRLIGYENRLLRDEDFNDDAKDAGEIGAGHSVTALYEVVPAGRKVENPGVDDLKYQRPAEEPERTRAGEMLTVKLRYKEPDGEESKALNVGVVDARGAHQNASDDFKFASAVAQFGMLLRDSRYRGQSGYDRVLGLARSSAGADLRGHRAEFIKLVETAQALAARERAGR